MLIKQLTLKNFLSFGPKAVDLELGHLNVIIGPNGSGKSNLIEAINLLQAAPKDLATPIRELGGVGEWIWKGGKGGDEASIDAIIEKNPKLHRATPLRYHLGFREESRLLYVVEERIETEDPYPGHDKPYLYFENKNGRAVINIWEEDGRSRGLEADQIDTGQSILSQRKDPDRFRELTYLGRDFGRIRIYRDWSFGRYAPMRLPQRPDLPNKSVEENASNLGLVLNDLQRDPGSKKKFLEFLRNLYEGISDFGVHIEGNTIQVFLEEVDITVPATRLSDGTLRYLYLLAILCHPGNSTENSTLICIEEPELGLHPDILPSLADVLRDASERMQIIVTTHSDRLVDALTDVPESVFVTEKHDGQTTIERLRKADLEIWLKKYSLGELWTRGSLGGNRW